MDKEKVTLKIATQSDGALLLNYLNMYYNEIGKFCSEFQDVDDNGYFDAHVCESILHDSSVMPLLIKYDERNIGFLILTIAPHCPEGCDFCIAELFVTGYWRGKGVPDEALNQVFALFPGTYVAAPQIGNAAAIAFFKRVFEKYKPEVTEADEFTIIKAEVPPRSIPRS